MKTSNLSFSITLLNKLSSWHLFGTCPVWVRSVDDAERWRMWERALKEAFFLYYSTFFFIAVSIKKYFVNRKDNWQRINNSLVCKFAKIVICTG